MATDESQTVDTLLQKILASTQQVDSPPGPGLLPNGKKTRGRVKVDMAFIKHKNRRTTTFSKRKHGLFKKVQELNCLTGAQCMMVVVSETGLVYTYASKKFAGFMDHQGKQMVTNCMTAPDPVPGELPPVAKLTFAPRNSPKNKSKWSNLFPESGTPSSDTTPSETFYLDSMMQQAFADGSDNSDLDIDSEDETDSEPLNLIKVPENQKTNDTLLPTDLQTFNMFKDAAALFMMNQQFNLVNSAGIWYPPQE